MVQMIQLYCFVLPAGPDADHAHSHDDASAETYPQPHTTAYERVFFLQYSPRPSKHLPLQENAVLHILPICPQKVSKGIIAMIITH